MIQNGQITQRLARHSSMLALAVGLNISVTTAHASQIDGQWAPRTVQEINIASFGGYGNVTGVQAADFLFNQWKNSPGHNANMLTPSYTHVSFGVYTDEESVYGATIFTQ